DPMMQVIHEEDAAQAFELSLREGLRGVFNVVGPGEVPLSVLISETGGRKIPMPHGLARRLLGRFGLPKIPPGALDYLKYAATVVTGSDGAARASGPRATSARRLAAKTGAASIKAATRRSALSRRARSAMVPSPPVAGSAVTGSATKLCPIAASTSRCPPAPR